MSDEGEAFELGDGLTARAYNGFDELIARSSRPDRLTMVSDMHRPGVRRFIVRLEHEYFPPLSPMNDEFELEMLNWEGMQWWLVMVPLSAKPICETLAAACALRLAEGFPCMFGGVEPVRFPVHHDRVYSISNIPGSRVYSRGGYEQLAMEEQVWIKAYFDKLRFDERNPQE